MSMFGAGLNEVAGIRVRPHPSVSRPAGARRAYKHAVLIRDLRRATSRRASKAMWAGAMLAAERPASLLPIGRVGHGRDSNR